ncbi:hypothetical protein BC939DRAFT_172090 [Gamsiella multidivaricata]|uniref:uncharacterized protein n=1 Tax=Gamsiella multidivaricata TaxID=101098 RepID=UPI002220CB7C|nr:uncharacterized protein BC939DRAFT_172090 [Gamsiella multidivaricata]KAI7822849.1 hypothetical protein BC939DRAFT_172090 [Gamsiella multidivaricata]
MLDTPEPLKMFGKASNSGLGPSFGSGDNSLSASGLRAKSTLDRFQQLKLSNANLSESMSTSQLLAKEQQTNSSLPLAVTTGHSSRRSNLSDVGPGSPTGPSGVSRHSQSFTHQPPTPSPLHTEIPVHPPKSSGRFESQPIQAYSTTRQGATGNTPTKRHSWLGSGSGGSSSSYSGMHHELARKNMGNMAFRHGSLDQGKDILGMEEAMGRMGVAAPDDIAYGSFPEDLHHQHSLYSAPLNTGREKKGDAIDNSPTAGVPFGPDPRPIPSLASGETSTSRPGRLLRLGSGSGFALPRLRTRAADDNESLNEMNSADSSSARGNKGRSRGRGEDDEEDEDDEDARGARSGRERDDKHEANTSINDDDDMLFIMSELSPASTFGQDPSLTAVGSTGVILGGAHDRGMLPLTGAILNLRSQPQSPSFDPHHGNSGSGGTAAGSSSVSPHLRLFGRGGNGNNLGAEHSNNNSRSNSAAHSRVGSSSGSNTNVQNSIENLGLLRRPGSGSGFVDEYNLPSASSTPPPFATVTGAGAFDAMLEGRRMSRGGSDRGIGSGANSGHNSFHSDSRGGRIEGW